MNPLYSTRTELRSVAAGVLASMVTDPVTSGLIDAVLAASAHTDPTGTTNVHTADSLRSAVGSVILAQALTPRDALLANILFRLDVLESNT